MVSHLVDEKTKSERGQALCPKMHRQEMTARLQIQCPWPSRCKMSFSWPSRLTFIFSLDAQETPIMGQCEPILETRKLRPSNWKTKIQTVIGKPQPGLSSFGLRPGLTSLAASWSCGVPFSLPVVVQAAGKTLLTHIYLMGGHRGREAFEITTGKGKSSTE